MRTNIFSIFKGILTMFLLSVSVSRSQFLVMIYSLKRSEDYPTGQNLNLRSWIIVHVQKQIARLLKTHS